MHGATFAVHVMDGVLTPAWLLGGFGGAALLVGYGSWRVREEEIPRVALLTAAFFVASSIHVRVPPTSAHLLLNGLVGVLLGRRAGLAIVVGVVLQAFLLGHGGITAIGINSCVLAIPALLAGQLFHGLRRVPWLRHPWARSALVAGGVWLWLMATAISVALLMGRDVLALPPVVWPFFILLALCVALLERRLEQAPEFPLGLLVGELAVLMTLALNCLVLTLGGSEDWSTVALLVLIAQLPLAAIEGVVLGFTVGFLARVKPEMLDGPPPETTPCDADGPS